MSRIAGFKLRMREYTAIHFCNGHADTDRNDLAGHAYEDIAVMHAFELAQNREQDFIHSDDIHHFCCRIIIGRPAGNDDVMDRNLLIFRIRPAEHLLFREQFLPLFQMGFLFYQFIGENDFLHGQDAEFIINFTIIGGPHADDGPFDDNAITSSRHSIHIKYIDSCRPLNGSCYFADSIILGKTTFFNFLDIEKYDRYRYNLIIYIPAGKNSIFHDVCASLVQTQFWSSVFNIRTTVKFRFFRRMDNIDDFHNNLGRLAVFIFALNENRMHRFGDTGQDQNFDMLDIIPSGDFMNSFFNAARTQ